MARRGAVFRIIVGLGEIRPDGRQSMLSDMFGNLGWTWKREPVLYIALLIAVGTVVQDAFTGGVDLESAVIGVVELLLGFVARGRVSPN